MSDRTSSSPGSALHVTGAGRGRGRRAARLALLLTALLACTSRQAAAQETEPTRAAEAEAARRALRETEVRLDEARVQLRRRSQLFKEGIITAAEFDAAEAEVASLDARLAAEREQISVAESQIALEQTNLENTVIRAPFSGVAISIVPGSGLAIAAWKPELWSE